MTSAPPTDQEIQSALPAAGGGEPPPRPSQRVGRLLRRTRESHHMELPAVAAALRIRLPYLEAIEEGHYERLPGPTYAVGFVRAYAVYLGLDGEEAVRRFKREDMGFESQRDLRLPMPLAERSIPGGPILVAALVLAVCGYGLWYYLTSSARPRTELVGAVPEALVKQLDRKPGATETNAPPPANGPGSPVTALAAPGTVAAAAADGNKGAAPSQATPSPSPANPGAPAAAANAVGTPASPAAPVANLAAASPPPATPKTPLTQGTPTQASAPPVPSAPAPTAPANPTKVATAAPVPAAPAPKSGSGRVFGATDGPVRVVVTAKADAWVQVKDGDENVVFAKLLHSGDVYRAPDRPGLVLRTGNGEGLAIAVDGRNIQLAGSAKVRNLALDPDRLTAGTAAQPN